MDRATFVMSYGLSFMTIAATITHAALHFWKPIKIHFKRSLREQPDIHAQLMAQYKQGAWSLWGCCLLNNKHVIRTSSRMVVLVYIRCVSLECWKVQN
jgi:hypothetical protein